FYVNPPASRPSEAARPAREPAVALAAPSSSTPSGGAASANLVSQMIVRLDEPLPRSPAAEQVPRQDTSLRRELDQARAELERLRERSAALEGAQAQAERSTRELEAGRVEIRRLQKDLEARAADAKRSSQIAQDLEKIRAERDELLAKRSTEQ